VKRVIRERVAYEVIIAMRREDELQQGLELSIECAKKENPQFAHSALLNQQDQKSDGMAF
jgi:hypothetical protein